jgi:hypothetical protein
MKNFITIVVKRTTHRRMRKAAAYPKQSLDEIINKLLDKNGRLTRD